MFTRALHAAAAAVCLVLGVVGALAVPAAALGGMVLGAFVGVVAALDRQTATGRGRRTVLSGRRFGLVVGGVVAAGWLVLTGLVALSGAGSVPVVLAVVAGAAAAWLWRRSRRPDTAGPVGPWAGPAAVAPPAAMSLPELCAAWQSSHLALLGESDGPRRGELVLLRECLLDELERRDGDGFTRWLATGAHARVNPDRYLVSDR